MIDFGYELRRLACRKYGNLMLRTQCPTCGEPVEPDDSINLGPNDEYPPIPNATCATHGRVVMPLAGRVAPR